MVPATCLPVARAQPMIRWSRMILTLAFLLGAYTGTGLLLKRYIFKLKSWIRGVVWEDDCATMIASQRKVAEEAALAAASAAKAASVAAIEVANVSWEVIMIHTEEKRYVTSIIQALKAHTADLTRTMKSLKMVMEGVNNTRPFPANLLAIGNQMEEKKAIPNNPGLFNQPLSYISKSSSTSAHKDLVSGNGQTTHTSEAPSLSRPDSTPHSTNYQKIFKMLERGEMPPGIKNIDDKPPNPDQPPSASRLQPRQKPWEMGRMDVGSSLTQIQSPIMNTVNSTFYSSSSEQVDSVQPRYRLKDSDTKSEATQQNKAEVKQNAPFNWPSEDLGRPKEIGNAMSRAAESSPTTSSLDQQGKQKVWVPPSIPEIVMPGAAAAIETEVYVQDTLKPPASTKQSAGELNEELPLVNVEMVVESTSAQPLEESTRRTMDSCATGKHEDTVIAGAAEKARSSRERPSPVTLSPVTMCYGFESEKVPDLQSFEDLADHTSCQEPAASKPANMSIPVLEVTDSSHWVGIEPVVTVQDVPPATGISDISIWRGKLQDIANSSPVTETLVAQQHLMYSRADEEYMQDLPESTASMEAGSLQNIQKSTVAAEATESMVIKKPAVILQDVPSSTGANGVSMEENVELQDHASSSPTTESAGVATSRQYQGR